jgi:biopolymer transport protein ExbD
VNPNCTDPTSLTVERLLAGLLLAAAVAVLGACHVPPPVVRSVLHITATGDVTLDGKAIAPAELQAALAARKAASTELEVEVRASAQADISRVQAVIASAKHAQVRVSFAREDGRP